MLRCEDCNGEHEDWAAECTFCGGELSEHAAAGEPVDHGVAEIDVTHLTDDERALMPSLLEGSSIPFEFTATALKVPKARREDAEGLVAVVVEDDPDDPDDVHILLGDGEQDEAWDEPLEHDPDSGRSHLLTIGGWLLFLAVIGGLVVQLLFILGGLHVG